MPSVAIVMGSDSDWPVMQKAADTLTEFGISYETRILSAHRSPDSTMQFAKEAASRGIRVIIAAAGGAAHLAGVIAAGTVLPVVAVPMPTPQLGGVDSLLSMVQMPSGVPVATVSIGGARNGAILASQILALADGELTERLSRFKQQMAGEVTEKDRKFSGGSGIPNPS